MILLGVIGVVANINPVQFLQKLVVFSTTATAGTFVAPALMLAFWRRATARRIAGRHARRRRARCSALFTCRAADRRQDRCSIPTNCWGSIRSCGDWPLRACWR